MRSLRWIVAAMAVVAAGPGAAQPLVSVPAAFAAGQYDAAFAPLLAEVETLEAALAADERRAVAPLVVATFANNGRIAEAQRRALAIVDEPTRARALVAVASAQAIAGDAVGARASIADALALDRSKSDARPDGLLAVPLAGVWARLGEDERAIAAAHGATGVQRVFALLAVAGAGPTGRADAAPERARAELSRWAPGAEPPDAVAPALEAIVGIEIRYGEGSGVFDRIAAIQDSALRTRALLVAAGGLAARHHPDLAERALREAEASLGPDLVTASGTPAERMRSIAQPWLAYAYAARGDARAGPALAASLAAAERIDARMQRVIAYTRIAGMIYATRREIALASARAGSAGAAPGK